MAITIDWGTRVISVPKADMTLIQSNPTEIRELDVNNFHLTLRGLEDDDEGMPFPRTHNHAPPVAIGGVTLARVVELVNNYTVTFEDGQYAVNLTGANNNIGDNVNVNQVSVRSANSAGLVQTSELEFGAYGGGVTVDQANGAAGQGYPLGTEESPVNNMDDAVFIGNLRGFSKIFIRGDYVFGASEVIDNFELIGQNPDQTTITLTAAASITNCRLVNASINGSLDGACSIDRCYIGNLDYIDGAVLNSGLLEGTIVLGGAHAEFDNCYSAVPGTATPTINFDNGTTNVLFRNYAGGLRLINRSQASDVSLDFISGQLQIDSTVSAGTLTVRGITKVVDNSTGTAVINDETISTQLRQLWKLQGLDPLNPMTVTPTTRNAGSEVSQVISGDGTTTTTVTRQ